MFRRHGGLGSLDWRSLVLAPGALLCMVSVLCSPAAFAANPAAYETYFVPLPDGWLMQHMEDIDADGGTVGDVYPPVRDVVGITVSANNTLLYWDQWEDGSYDADIANPGANTYDAVTNPDGTQIWGDSNLANGCAPRIGDIPNPCLVPADDKLSAGDVIVLDNLVPITSQSGVHGPWFVTSPAYDGRGNTPVRFDGKDKFGATYPVAATRAGWSEGTNGSFVEAGSLFSDATAIEPTTNWGTSFVVPVGTNTTGFGADTDMNYAHVTVQAAQNGTTVCVDVPPINNPACNGAGDSSVTINAGVQYDPTAMPSTASPQGVPQGTEVRTNNPVQVILVTGDVGSTWATRWYNLTARPKWTNDYYTPVGPTNAAAACTAVWVYNPNPASITVNYDFPGGASPDGTFTVASGVATKAPNITLNDGAHYYTTGGTPPVFYPVSVTECTGAQLYDWGFSLLPVQRLTDQVLVGWAPGCTTFSGPNECYDQTRGGNPPTDADFAVRQGNSRSPVWVTTLANSTVYVDLDGSGIDCPGGVGAEKSFGATALTSYPLVDDPVGIVRDEFSVQSYSNNNGTVINWSTSWTETGTGETPTSPSAGAIQINTTDDNLRFQPDSGSEAGRTIARSVNIPSVAPPNTNTTAKLTFFLGSSGTLDATDRLAVEVSSATGGPWTVLETFSANPSPNPTAKTYDISAFISANTTVRFRIVDNLEAGDYWSVDNVTIDYGTGQADFDMSGTRLRTCDGTKLAVAWGQDPWRSYSGDDEALDMGTTVFPLGANISIDKVVDKSWVTPGGQVIYTYSVRSTGVVPLSQVTVNDDRCAPATFQSGDTNANTFLDPSETWIYQCSARIFVDTINVATASGTPDGGSTFLQSAPDEARVRVSGAIGNYVWLDENGDGVQDAGEAGIPNVLVTLTGTNFEGAPVTLTTYTDANGGYIFTGLPPSDPAGYTVTVTPTAGLIQTYDENGLDTANATTVVLASGVEHLTADFGYNWSSPCETNTPGAADCPSPTGAIGDRVWIDANGDGNQDPNEIGLAGVTVRLYTAGPDGLFGTGDDVVAGTTTTNNNGNYIFDGLVAGAYVVKVDTTTLPAGYTQTGDPDVTLDNQTTAPVVLAPGDVYVNADFGYQPPAGTTGSIGDTVWMDANRDNTKNVGEPGIAGVTVSLIKDLNGNGAWDAGEPIIATDITGENGDYGFTGLPVTDGVGTDDYLVWVNDTNNVLGELTPTYDVRDGANQGNPTTGLVTGLEISAVTNLTTTAVDNADFAYAPAGQVSGTGLIGDTIFLDRDGGNDFDPGEGLEGVSVELLNASGNVIARTVTNENGQYFFGGLAAGTYTVRVNTNTLPSSGVGLTNTVDPDGGGNSQSVVALAAGGVNLAQDFGYRALTNPNSIGGTLWEDTNANGLLTELGRFSGVTVVLRDSNGKIVGTTTTDSNGDYLFSGLPNGTYTVDVTDDNNVLNGYWHSTGPNPGVNNNSQVDPYTVSVTGGQTNLTGDFGYYIEPAVVGNFVWNDLNGNGIQDSGEPGIPGVVVTMVVTWPSGAGPTTLKTTTDANGFYSFGNLLLDEDQNGLPPGPNPTFLITVATPPGGYLPTLIGAGTPGTDSNNPAGTTALPVQGTVDDTYDFGFTQYPTAVTMGDVDLVAMGVPAFLRDIGANDLDAAGLLAMLDAWDPIAAANLQSAGRDALLKALRDYLDPDGDGQVVVFRWETLAERGTIGFYAERSQGGAWSRINAGMLPGLIASPMGAQYWLADPGAQVGDDYQYRLEELDARGGTNQYGPFHLGTTTR